MIRELVVNHAGPGGGIRFLYVSDMVFNITGGETLTITTWDQVELQVILLERYSRRWNIRNSGGNGTVATSVSGTSTGSIFTLGGGIGAVSVSGGGVQGPLRTNNASTGGYKILVLQVPL